MYTGQLDEYLNLSQYKSQLDDDSVKDSKFDLKENNLKDHYTDVVFIKCKMFLIITGVDKDNQIRLIIKEIIQDQMNDVVDMVITSSSARIDPRTKVYKVIKNHVYFYVIQGEKEA
jgi:hypothetical protein